MTTKKSTTRIVLITISVVALAAVAFYTGRITHPDAGRPEISSTPETKRKIAYWRAPMDPTEIYDKPGKSKMGMDLVPVYEGEAEASRDVTNDDPKILYWRAPMDPTEIYDEPGKSKMGMDLVPVYEGEAGSDRGGAVTIDPETVQNMGVRTGWVERTDFGRNIRTVGKIEYNEETLHSVNTKISGWIERLHVSFAGELVERGDPLLEIYSPELVSTQQEYLLALRNQQAVDEAPYSPLREDADRLLESTRKRLEYWDIPESEIERLEEIGQVQRTVLLRSPTSGMVVVENAVEGSHVKAGVDLFEIADLSTVWVHASVYDYEVPWIEEGQPAEMELSYLPGKKYHGHVSFVYPYLREQARDVHVRVVFANPNLDLKPGMFVNIELTGRSIPDALVIPSEAVIRSGERAIVFVVRDRGKFEPREIRIGEEGGPDNAYVRVLDGLLEGEEIVTSAQFMLDSESRLQEAIQKMLRARSRPSTPDKPMTSGT